MIQWFHRRSKLALHVAIGVDDRNPVPSAPVVPIRSVNIVQRGDHD